MLENLKKLISKMDSKTEFVSVVSNYYGTSHKATMQNWFQGYWAIPEGKLPKVIEMAQNYLFAQTQKQKEVLEETGFDFKNQTI